MQMSWISLGEQVTVAKRRNDEEVSYRISRPFKAGLLKVRAFEHRVNQRLRLTFDA